MLQGARDLTPSHIRKVVASDFARTLLGSISLTRLFYHVGHLPGWFVFLPGEVATPILDQRPNPVGPDERARMVQPQDCADLILYIALLPKRLTMNEVMLSPTWNRAYVAAIRQLSSL